MDSPGRGSADGNLVEMPIQNRRLWRRGLALALAVLALALPPSGHAHGGGAARGYTSTVTGVSPPAAGLGLRILEGDDRIELVNDTGREIVVTGYDGEPYLRFSDRGVEVNLASPAHYLNDDRYAAVELPADADAEAPPRWQLLTDGNRWEWHDHRIHWMSEQDPPVVVAEPDVAHRIFDWTIPATVGGRPVEISGTLRYAPPPAASAPHILYLVIPLVAAAVLGVLALAWHRTRREPPSRPEGDGPGRRGHSSV
jgi:hypothetical protein